MGTGELREQLELQDLGGGTGALGGEHQSCGDMGAARGMGLGSMGPAGWTGATEAGRGTVRHMA